MPKVLRPVRIGPLQIDPPVVLAPLAGYSDMAFRRICRRLGAPYVTTEMLLDRCILAKGKLRRRILKFGEDEHPIAAQIIGNEPHAMAESAAALCEFGFDVIDLNFACPVNKALRRRRGGWLMREPQRALDIVRAVIPAAGEKPVTLKLRRRFADDDDDSAFWRIAEGAFDAGAAGICAHARTVEQKYRGRAQWGFLAEVKSRFQDRTVVGSGDVLAPEDALRMLDETGVDAAAVARGALGNPWFFRQVLDLAAGREPLRPTLDEQREMLAEHFRDACALYGERRAPRVMRKFGIRYARLHPSPKRVRMAFVAAKHTDDWWEVLDDLYTGEQDALPAGRSGE